MSWFARKVPPVAMRSCDKCGLCYYPPYVGYDKDYANLCPEHRKPFVDEACRKHAVVQWATDNWKSLEKQCKRETAKLAKTRKGEAIANTYNALQAAHQPYSGLYSQGSSQQNNPFGLHVYSASWRQS